MKTTISNKIIVEDASKELYWWCQDNLTVTNPQYATLKRIGKDEQIRRYHIEPNMRLYSERGLDLILPFGVLYSIWGFIRNDPVEIRLNDDKWIPCRCDSPTFPLYDYQEEAVQKMLAAKSGILIGGCGSGKTNCGIEIIRRIGKNALWLCHTKDLLNQTVARIKSLYPRMPIGTITDGKVDMVENGITVSTVQTLANIDPDEYASAFNTVVIDECFPAGTKIMTEGGSVSIEGIKVGDKVASYNHKTKKIEYKTVKHVFVKASSDLQLLKTSVNTVTATSNHPFYTQRGYVPLGDLKHGDYVLQIKQNDSHRGEWEQPLWECREGQRPEEESILVWTRVESVQGEQQANPQECSGGCPVYNIEVEDNNNYFAEGILVHNCHRVSGSPTLLKYFMKVVSKIPARHKFGLTASDRRNDTLTASMYTTIGVNPNGEFTPVWRIRREDAKTLTARHEKVELDTPFSYDMLNEDGTFNYAGLVDYISEYGPRNEFIADKVASIAKEGGHKQLILCARIGQCERLNEMLNARGVRSVLLVGKVSDRKRREILEQKVDWDAIVATVSLAKEGLDIVNLDTLHMVSCLGNKSDTVQSVGRIERVCEGKGEPVAYDYVDTNIPYLASKYKKRVGWLKRR